MTVSNITLLRGSLVRTDKDGTTVYIHGVTIGSKDIPLSAVGTAATKAGPAGIEFAFKPIDGAWKKSKAKTHKTFLQSIAKAVAPASGK